MHFVVHPALEGIGLIRVPQDLGESSKLFETQMNDSFLPEIDGESSKKKVGFKNTSEDQP